MEVLSLKQSVEFTARYQIRYMRKAGSQRRAIQHANSKLLSFETNSLFAGFVILVLCCSVLSGCATTRSQTVDAIIALSTDSDQEVRQTVVMALGKLRDPRSVEHLVQALNDRDQNVRMFAAFSLGDLKDPRAVEPLIEAFQRRDCDIHFAAAMALGKIGDQRAVEPLIDALSFPSDYVRGEVILSLGKIGDPRAIEPLMALLFTESELIRYDVVKALKMIGIGAREIECLESALQDKESHNSLSAAWALQQIRNNQELPAPQEFQQETGVSVRQEQIEAFRESRERQELDLLMATAFKDEVFNVRSSAAWRVSKMQHLQVRDRLVTALHDTDCMVRTTAAMALGYMKDTGAVEPLIFALRDESSLVRAAATKALRAIDDRRAVPPLVDALHEYYLEASLDFHSETIKDTDKRKVLDAEMKFVFEVVGALGNFKDRRASNSLISVAMRDNNYTNIQSEAAVALGRIQDPAAVEYFVSVLKNPDGKLRAAAAYALGNMKDARAARPLLAALKDIESDVRSKVVWALGEVLEKKEKGR